MAKKFNEKKFARKAVIFHEGDRGDCMYEILTGKVGIYINYGEKNEKRLAVLYSDDYFGEMSLIEGENRSATAVALESDTVLYEINADSFGDYVQNHEAIVYHMIQHQTARLRRLTQDYTEVCHTIASNAKNEEEGKEQPDEIRKALENYANQCAENF